MTQIVFVRHGQANSHADNEEDYDHLSPLGVQQAKWLGEYMRTHDVKFDRVFCGTLKRQQQTAQFSGHSNFSVDPRLDEISYFTMARAAQEQLGIPFPESPDQFAENLTHVLRAWKADELRGIPETFAHFEARVAALLADFAALGGRILVATSGGVIGMALRLSLSLELSAYRNLLLQIKNSSMHSFQHLRGTHLLSEFNAVPHLVHPDRGHAVTYV